MCLLDKKVLHVKTGYAFKTVNKDLIPGEYVGVWRNFYRNSGGFNHDARVKGKAFRNNVRWKVGRTYRVKHKRKTLTENQLVYPASVHLWKSFDRAQMERMFGQVILVCRYSNGEYQDTKALTARRVTPVLVLPNAYMCALFDILLKEDKDVGKAIDRYKTYIKEALQDNNI